MPKIERNKRIDKFITSAFLPIRNAMKELTVQVEDPDYQGDKNSLDFTLQTLTAYEMIVVSEFRTLQIETRPSPISVLRIYQSATKQTKKAIDYLQNDAGTSELILKNLGQVINFCSTVLTQNESNKFFDKKGFDIKALKKMQAELLGLWESFIKENNYPLAFVTQPFTL